MYKERKGNLVKLAESGEFDVVAHGCNCFCTMGAGIAPVMAKAFGCDKFKMEGPTYKGDKLKLGEIDYEPVARTSGIDVYVVNCYSQYNYGKNHKDGTKDPLDYTALQSCFTDMNDIFAGFHIGLPKIGCGLAGGDWTRVKKMIQDTFTDCDVTVVMLKK